MASSSKSNLTLNKTLGRPGSHSKLDKFFVKQQDHAILTSENEVLNRNSISLLSTETQPQTEMESVMPVPKSDNFNATVLFDEDPIDFNNLIVEPSQRAITINNSQNVAPSDLGEISPAQPHIEFLITADKRSFKDAWYKMFPWIVYSIAVDAAFCYPCRKFLPINSGDAETAFTIDGFRNWKKALEQNRGLKKHDTCQSHNKANALWLERKERDSSGLNIVRLLNDKQLENRRYYIKSIAEIIQFLVVNEISLRGHYYPDNDEQGIFENLFQFTITKDSKLKEICSTIPANAKYTSPEIQNEIISLMCKMVVDTLCLNIKNSNCYALLADSTRDKSNSENLAIGARFVNSEGKVTEYVFALCPMPAADAITISNTIFDSLQTLSLSFDKVISCSFDGANVMSGNNAGVQKLLCNKLNRNIPYVHCFNHQLHLAVLQIVGYHTISIRTFDIAEQLYVFFKRLAVDSRYEGHKLPRLLPQRWTGHIKLVEIIHSNFTEINNVLFLIAAQRFPESADTKGIFNRISTLEFCFVILLFEKLLGLLRPLNDYFEKSDADLTVALNLIDATCNSFTNMNNTTTAANIIKEANALLKSQFVMIPENDMDEIPTNSKRARRIPAKYRDNDQIIYGNESISLNSEPEPTALPQRLLKYYNEIIPICINELRNRFSEGSLAVVIAAKRLLSRETRTIDTCNMLYSLLPDNLYNFNNISSELNVLHNG